MSRMTPFNNPYLLGFDELERLLTSAAKSGGDGYPPYNIEQMDGDDIRISLAVAGFSQDDLDIFVEDSQLVIRGKQTTNEDVSFLHRGIAARQFVRKFVLAGGMDVEDAFLENGLLHIDLKRPKPETNRRVIEIR